MKGLCCLHFAVHVAAREGSEAPTWTEVCRQNQTARSEGQNSSYIPHSLLYLSVPFFMPDEE